MQLGGCSAAQRLSFNAEAVTAVLEAIKADALQHFQVMQCGHDQPRAETARGTRQPFRDKYDRDHWRAIDGMAFEPRVTGALHREFECINALLGTVK